jgi:hypothetical protein
MLFQVKSITPFLVTPPLGLNSRKLFRNKGVRVYQQNIKRFSLESTYLLLPTLRLLMGSYSVIKKIAEPCYLAMFT